MKRIQILSKNELGGAASPYLLQHKSNPVHWREWTPAALAEAKAANKPILLSIGYAACHWCHVMAHESFEHGPTANIMNSLFVNIKVDREERPDIDQIYMAALHAMGQPGGWPLTMFLTPDGEPFWGGTYFPREAAYGRPSFTQVLQNVARIFADSPEKVVNNTTALRQAITELESSTSAASITNTDIDQFARQLYPHMDMQNGGLQGAPKFPSCQTLELLLRAADRTADEIFSAPVILTLEKICRGGIHDHVGGGFSRYCVDERWHVPHFEKMLYDNAQILELLGYIWTKTKRDEFRTAAESMVEWLKREMIDTKGMMAASLDADSEGVEGKYYCWTLEEIIEVLDPEETALFCHHYGIQPDGNWQEIHTGARTNIPNRLDDKAADRETESHLHKIREKLLHKRMSRIPPLCDDKNLADWNGMMIAALSRAAVDFKRPEWLLLASRCFHSVIESMTRREGEYLRLGHSFRDERLVWPGMSSDYACMIRAALCLNECGADFTPARKPDMPDSYLELADQLARSLIRFHAHSDTGVLSLPAVDADDVIYKTFNSADDATPNPNSLFLQSLQILAAATGDHFFNEQASRMIRSIAPSAIKNPFGHASFLNAMDTHLNAAEIIVIGQARDQMLAQARQQPLFRRLIVELDETSIRHSSRFTAAEAAGSASAFICHAGTCSLPVTDPAKIKTLLAEIRHSS